MSGWMIEHNSGLWTLHNPVGRPVLDIAFRHDIPEGLRQKVLARLAVAMSMPDETWADSIKDLSS